MTCWLRQASLGSERAKAEAAIRREDEAQQRVPRPLALLARDYPAGARTGAHSHPRHQLLHAVDGLMTADTARGTWVVPSGFALWIPAGVEHDIAMQADVAMRTAYVAPGLAPAMPEDCRVIAVSPLLKAALLALVDEPLLYDEAGRAGHLAALVLDEILRAAPTPYVLPMPQDPRLARLCRALIASPGSGLDIDAWADKGALSRRTLTRLFRAETGLSFGAWRRRLRLLNAQERCARGEPLARVAADLGYGSLPAFRAMARRELGDTSQLHRASSRR